VSLAATLLALLAALVVSYALAQVSPARERVAEQSASAAKPCGSIKARGKTIRVAKRRHGDPDVRVVSCRTARRVIKRGVRTRNTSHFSSGGLEWVCGYPRGSRRFCNSGNRIGWLVVGRYL